MNILFVVHNFVGNGPIHGGTELHVRDMVEQYKKDEDNHVWLLYPKHGLSRLRYVFINTRTGTQAHFDVTHPVTWECYQHQDFSRKIVPFLLENKIDVVHFFHLMHFPLSLPLVVQQTGIRVVVSFFDYYLVCRKFNLLTDKDSRFCGYPKVCASTCDLCLRTSFGYAPATQLNRRKLISEILYHADAVHYLCSDLRERMIATYPHLKDKPELVMGLGMKEEYLAQAAQQNTAAAHRERMPGQPLHIACLGNFVSHKGADLILSLMEHYRLLSIDASARGREAPVHFHLYGASQHSEDHQINRFIKAGFVTVHGRYKPEELPKLLAECDVALFASIWPETFALVLSEVWVCHLVPIAPCLGAFGERITHGVTGMHYDLVGDPGSVIDVIDELTNCPQKITEMRAVIAQLVPLTLQDNREEYSRFYRQVVEQESREQASVAQVSLPGRPPEWHLVVTDTGGVVPASPRRETGNKALLQRAWGVLRRRGVRHSVNALLDYMHVKRG